MDTIETSLDGISNFLNQLYSLPGGTLVFLMCLVVGGILKHCIKNFPNNAIPLVVILFGGISYIIIADTNTVMHFRIWLIRSFFIGCLIATTAWVTHKKFLKKFEDKYFPLEDVVEENKPNT